MVKILLLHVIIATFSIYFANLGCRINRKVSSMMTFNLGYFISFFLLLCFLGFRESLGLDLLGYERIYSADSVQQFTFGETRELGFLYMVNLMKSLGLDFGVFVFFTSLIALFLFFFSYKNNYYLLPVGIFVFFTDWGYPVVINTIRQGIAIMAFLNATYYIDSQDKHAGRKYLLFMAIGLLFHYSILFLLPFYYVGRLKINFDKFLFLLVGVIILSFFVIMPVYEQTFSMIEKYEGYTMADNIVNKSSSWGLGATLVLLIRWAPLTIYKYVFKKHPVLLKYYVLYFIGLSIYYGFYKFLLITRVTFYLQFLALFVQAFFIYYLFMINKRYRYIGIIYVFLIIFNYVYTFDGFLAGQVVSNNVRLMFMDFYYKSLF